MERQWKAYCPLMKGVCVNGFVKGQMPEDENTGERTKCAFFITLKGKDPQSQKEYDDPGCSWHWLPILQVETNQMVRFNVASTDKVASEVKSQHDTFLGLAAAQAERKFLEAQ